MSRCPPRTVNSHALAGCLCQGYRSFKKVCSLCSCGDKKGRYWPKHIPGDEIDDKRLDVEVGSVDSLHGTIDNEPYVVYAMKDP